MNQKQYTWSIKDRKLFFVTLFLHFSFVLMSISFFGLYYKGQVNDCKRMVEKLELAEWAKAEMDKSKEDFKIESLKQNYESKGILAEEF